MPEQNEWHAYLAKQEQRKRAEKAREVAAVAPIVRDTAFKAQQVLDHPAWQWFATQLEARISDIEGGRKAKMNTLVYGTAMGHELELLKIELNTMDAEVAGLRYAVTLAGKAVEMGQQIAGELSQVAAGSADR